MTGFRRRTILAGAALLALPVPLWAAPAVERRLVFEVRRNGVRIGSHLVSFQGDDHDFTASIEAQFVVMLGPLPIFHYEHHAREVWRDSRFQSLLARTTSNGKVDQVSAIRTGDGVSIVSGARRFDAPASAHPLTHWNPAVLDGALFSPQTGLRVRESVSRTDGQTLVLMNGRSAQATRYTLAGDADIVDWAACGSIRA